MDEEQASSRLAATSASPPSPRASRQSDEIESDDRDVRVSPAPQEVIAVTGKELPTQCDLVRSQTQENLGIREPFSMARGVQVIVEAQ